MIRKAASTILCLATLIPSVIFAQTSFTNVASGPAPGNGLRQILDFQTSPASRAFVSFGFWNGTDSVWIHTDVSALSTAHNHVLTGLRPNTAYDCRITAFDSTGIQGTTTHSFISGTAPSGLPLLDTIRVSASFPHGYLLTANSSQDSLRMALLYDTQGQLIWFEAIPGQAQEHPCQTFAANDRLGEVVLTDCDSVHTLRFDGKNARNIKLPFAQTSLAQAVLHDQIEFRNDHSFQALIAVPDTITRLQAPFETHIVLADALVSFDSSSFILDASYSDAENPQDAPQPGGKWQSLFGPTACEWKNIHGFSIDFDDYPVLSANSTNQIQKFDASNSVSWTMGPQGIISIYPSDSLFSPSGIYAPGDFSYLSYEQNLAGGPSRVVKWYIDWSYIVPEFISSWEFNIDPGRRGTEGGSIDPVGADNYLVSSRDGGGMWILNENGAESAFYGMDGGIDFGKWVERLYPAPAFSYNTTAAVACVQDSLFQLSTLGMQPAGGFFSGPGVAGQTFDAASLGAGTHIIVYHFGADSMLLPIVVSQGACGASTAELFAKPIEWQAYPNPFSDRVNIQAELVRSTGLHWQLYSADGRLLDEGTPAKAPRGAFHAQINTGQWPSGQLLFLVLRTSEGESAGKWLMRKPLD